MSKSAYPETDDRPLADDPDAPTGEVNLHKRYVTGAGEPIPVQSDIRPVEDPVESEMGDIGRQIRRDEEDTMDRSNVMKGRTRKERPRFNYQEGVDESLGLDYRR